MFPPRKHKQYDAVHAVTYPFGEFREPPDGHQAMALLALSHTPVEHRLYRVMLHEAASNDSRVGAFSVRRLMILTGLHSYSTIRRARVGLLNKLSIESLENGGDKQQGPVYLVFGPEEIFARRRAAGLAPYPKEVKAYEGNQAFGRAIERVVGHYDLSRREAQVALCCAEGMTNAEIGEKLHVSEQTIKFHLRHIFVKFGVKRRAELVSRLLTQGTEQVRGEYL